MLLMTGGIFAVFGSRSLHFSGAGPLGVLTIAFVAALRWRKEISSTAEVHCCHGLCVPLLYNEQGLSDDKCNNYTTHIPMLTNIQNASYAV